VIERSAFGAGQRGVGRTESQIHAGQVGGFELPSGPGRRVEKVYVPIPHFVRIVAVQVNVVVRERRRQLVVAGQFHADMVRSQQHRLPFVLR